MTTINRRQRRYLLKLLAASSISPSVLVSQPSHAIWPWFLRIFGINTARKTISRATARRELKALRDRAALPTAYQGAQTMLELSEGALFFGTLKSNLAAKAGLLQLSDEGDHINVPETQIDLSQIQAAQFPLLEIEKVKAMYLDVPPLTTSIQDNITWGVVDVVNGGVTRIGKGPLAVTASTKSETLELPLGRLSVFGPHQFVAVLEKNAESVPILSTSVLEVR